MTAACGEGTLDPLFGSIKHEALHEENLEELPCEDTACAMVLALSDSL